MTSLLQLQWASRTIQTPVRRESWGSPTDSSSIHREEDGLCSEWSRLMSLLLLPSHPTTLSPPIPLLIQYAQTEPFLPNSSSMTSRSLKVKTTQIWRRTHILCNQTTDYVPTNLEIWVHFTVLFGFLDFLNVAPPPPRLPPFFSFWFVSLFFCGVS